ncbi:MAG: hypoxanthine phosphoribosyltransferase [Verrucomicrobiales bacterium]
MSAESMESASTYQHSHLERVLFDQASIRERVAEMGATISREYTGDGLTIVAVLQGGALFMADLIREIRRPLQLESISVASYHGGTSSSGTVTFNQSRLPEVKGRDVLILDDILDTGRTMAAIKAKLEKECSPHSVKSAVLLSKRIARAVEVEADYVGFEVGDEFVVGYGLDYQGHYRNLPVIGVLKPEYI